MNPCLPLQTITYRQVLDLSHPIHPDIPLWTGDPPVQMEPVAQIGTDGYYLRRFSMGEHSGTHMNAPNSFFANTAGIDAYSPASLVLPGVVISIQAQAATNPDYQLNLTDIAHWETVHGTIPPGCIVLLHTGWETHWDNPAAYLNQNDTGYHFPGFSAAATKFLLIERAIAGVGIDTHGVDSGQDTDFHTNQLVLRQQGIVLENLTNLDQLPPKGTTLIIGILRLQGGSGSPVSVLALVP